MAPSSLTAAVVAQRRTFERRRWRLEYHRQWQYCWVCVAGRRYLAALVLLAVVVVGETVVVADRCVRHAARRPSTRALVRRKSADTGIERSIKILFSHFLSFSQFRIHF